METQDIIKGNPLLPEQKRAESVKQMIKTYQKQKLAIKEALCNLDNRPNKKIIFDDDLSDQTPIHNDTSESTNKRKSLFHSDDEDEDLNFEVKNQFDGQHGQQLFQLQTKFKGDKRFAFDERFTENNDMGENQSESAENSLEKEKQSEIEILEQVLGTKIKSSKQKAQEKGSSDKKMLRFDPTQSDHSKYEITVEKKKPNKMKRKHDETNEEEKAEPLVSKDVFYKVTNDLKTTLQTEGEFSLRNLFSREDQDQEEDDPQPEEQAIPLKNRGKLNGESNPFRYDSSDDEAEDVPKREAEKPLERKNNVLKSFTEPFFFKEDDYRFQEGTDFVKRIASETNEAFGEQRRNLKNIVKAKVKNNQRKNNPFKKKLGGNKKRKVNRINRALKR